MVESKRSILLVDDEKQVRGVLTETLKNAGYLVFDAGNYYEALEVLERVPDVDLLITDVSMPGPNGCELALRFLESRPNGRVLFISGYTGAEVCRHYDIKLSDKEFIAKPLYPRLFLERVGSILSEPQACLPTWAQERLGQRETEAVPQP